MLYLRKTLLFGALFFFIFAPRVNIGPGVNLGMAAVLVVGLMNIDAVTKLSLSKSFGIFVCIFFFLGLYSYCMAEFYGNDPAYFSSICISVVICVAFGWGFARIYSASAEPAPELVVDLFQLIVLAVLINSIVMLFEYFVPGVKETLEGLLVQSELANINYAEHPFRLRGFASAGGAALSIVNAIGVMLVIFLVRRGSMRGLIGVVISVVLAVSNIFAGRTGLIASLGFTIILLLFLLWNSVRSGIVGIMRGIVLFALVGWFVANALNFDLDAEVSRWAFEWVDGLATGKVSSTSSDDLGTMLFLPTDAVDLLFGAGFFEGENGKYMRSDSGYVKTVLSVGMLFGSLMYAVIGWLFYRVALVSREYFWIVCAILVFMYVMEIKEPFLYQNFAARVLFLLSGSAWYILWRRKFESPTLS